MAAVFKSLYTGNMDNITDGDYYIYAFVSLTESPDTLTFESIYNNIMFLADGKVRLTGTGKAAVTPNVRSEFKLS